MCSAREKTGFSVGLSVEVELTYMEENRAALYRGFLHFPIALLFSEFW
jgi:hypothetical protein